jgi:hypothetical protein
MKIKTLPQTVSVQLVQLSSDSIPCNTTHPLLMYKNTFLPIALGQLLISQVVSIVPTISAS